MADIKPIETIYKGYRFRSRLEARWAVFFDSLEIKYEYEPEGFELDDGVRYLPDFWLPDFQVHVEVKPHHEFSKEDIRKVVLFAANGDKSLLLIVGSPTSQSMYLLGRQCLEAWSYFVDEYKDEDVALLRALFWEGIQEWADVEFGFMPRKPGLHLLYRIQPPLAECNIGNALIAAKQARFEHGKKGN